MTSRKQKVLKVSAITALCLITHIPCANATTYYVSSSQGNNTNSGTSVEQPWHSISNVYYNTFGGRTYKPGDSILFKAGDSFCGPLLINQGGTNESPITIGSYGTGPKPIIYGDFSNAVWTAVGGHTGIYSTFVGAQGPANVSKVHDINGNLYVRRLRGTDSLDDWLNTFTNNNWGVSATLTVYIRTLDDQPPPRMYLLVGAVVALSGDYHTVTNLEICRGGHGINTGGIGNIVTGNFMHDLFGSGVYLNTGSSSEIANNLITNTSYTMIYLVGGGGNWVHHNELHKTSLTILGNVVLPSGSDRSNIGLLSGTNNLIEHNNMSYAYHSFFDYFYEVDTEVRHNYGFSASGAASPTGSGLKLHHNVFNLNHSGSGITGGHLYSAEFSPVPDTGPNLIYNNVVFGFHGYGLYATGSGASGTIFRNNIIIMNDVDAGSSLSVLSTGVDSDYNLYYSTTNAPRWIWNATNLYYTVPSLASATGQEAHSLYLDPQFVSIKPVTAADFRLKPTSPGIDVGQYLQSVGLLAPEWENKDYLGTLIHQGAGAEIGAYENQTNALATPTNLRVFPR